MNKFRFKYPLAVWVMLSIIALLFVAGLIWDVYNVVESVRVNIKNVAVFSVIAVLNAVFLIFSIGLITYGRYVFKGENLYCRFGFVFSKYSVAEITDFSHYRKSDKLVAHFKNGKYTVIVISPSQYDEFVKTARKINENIYYDEASDYEEV